MAHNSFLCFNESMNTSELQTVLWDIERNKVDSLPLDFVIQRVLSYGTLQLIIASIEEHGAESVKKIFFEMKPTSISEKKYQYLKNHLFQ